MAAKDRRSTSGEKPGRRAEEPGRRGQERLADVVARIASPVLRRRGFANASLLAHWEDIVGPSLSRMVWPDRLKGTRDGSAGVLHLVAASGSVKLEINHTLPQIIERVNGFLGYQAVERIVTRVGRCPRPETPVLRRPPPPVPPREQTRIQTLVDPVPDPELREQLKALALAVSRRQTPR
ncbi:DUF721 domain-containing protein [Phaeovibrio sulfidiphilus]|uniref:DUF721 domain-containing protein n=1 Tax=Phaeovibrio sulfidiphilus TaxID=1220600 RepID=A0A8J6YIA7_9PROT|nr:DUF721 domain-containing protein [Phaeovibrio sulfidiphilus]